MVLLLWPSITHLRAVVESQVIGRIGEEQLDSLSWLQDIPAGGGTVVKLANYLFTLLGSVTNKGRTTTLLADWITLQQSRDRGPIR